MNIIQETNTGTFVPGFGRLDDTIDDSNRLLLPQLVKVMTGKLKTTVAIYFLGTLGKRDKPVPYFLIITSNSEQRNSLSLVSMVEESCQGIAPVIVFVHNADNVITAATGGNHFFASILLHRSLVYLSGDLLLPKPGPLNYPLHLQAARKIWERWYGMSLEFSEGAKFYVERKNYRLALFSLHQATECILKAINRAVTGYRIEVHNLSRLLTISTLFSNNLMDVFPMKTEDGILEFDLLKHAYTQSRYKDDFEPEEKQVKALFHHVLRLQEESQTLYIDNGSSIDAVK